MILNFGTKDINTDDFTPQEGRVRVTTDVLNSRVTLKKTEQLLHKYHTSDYLNLILVEKFIDNTLVHTWSWYEPITKEETKEFPYDPYKLYHTNYNNTKRSTLTKEERRRRACAYAAQYREDHREEVLQKKREYARRKYAESHPKSAPRTRKTPKEYCDEHKEEERQRVRDYYQTNKEKMREKARRYYQTNKEKLKERARRYYHTHKEDRQQKQREYYEKNKDRWKTYYNFNK